MWGDLGELTISEIIRLQADGELTAEQLVYFYMDRISRFDKAGPGINALLELNPDAPAIAAGLDTARSSAQKIGPLHGVPILLKDNINTGDKLHTSAGSLAMAESYAPKNSFLVDRLVAAGAVILGKANMTEWANFMTRGMPNGYSSRGGQVINPYGRDLDVGGSSSGSGAGVAANLCAVAIGTETSGSILSPAINNMLVGIKPTVGLVSRSGVIPISSSQDTAGPLARTVADAAAVLSELRGIDPSDPATVSSAPHLDTNYLDAIGKDTTGLRVGVPRGLFWEHLSKEEAASTESTIQTLRGMGFEIVDPAEFPLPDGFWVSKVLIHEFKNGINAYLASLGPGAPVGNLNEVIDFNRTHKTRALKYGQTLLRESQRFTSGTLTEPEYLEARLNDLKTCRYEGIDAVMERYKLDLLLFPAYYGCAVAARAGYPSISVPTGFVASEKGKKPFGITFTGPAFSESLLISAAAVVERTIDARVPPDLDRIV